MSNKPKPKKQTEVKRLTERVSRIEKRAAAQARLARPVRVDMAGCAYTELAVERSVYGDALVLNKVTYGSLFNLFRSTFKYRRKRISWVDVKEATALRDFLTAYLDAR